METKLLWERVKELEELAYQDCICVDAYDDENRCERCKASYELNAIDELLKDDGMR